MSAPITVRDAFRKGRASGRTQVDPDEAIARFSAKYCQHPRDRFCELEHAWWNGFEEAPFGESHALKCPRGVASPQGHSECRP